MGRATRLGATKQNQHSSFLQARICKNYLRMTSGTFFCGVSSFLKRGDLYLIVAMRAIDKVHHAKYFSRISLAQKIGKWSVVLEFGHGISTRRVYRVWQLRVGRITNQPAVCQAVWPQTLPWYLRIFNLLHV